MPLSSDTDVHACLFSSDHENIEVTVSSFNMKPNIPERVVFWQDEIGGEVLVSLSLEEASDLCAALSKELARRAQRRAA